MQHVHLLHGLPGTGKTTYARRLERKLKAVRFTHDEWMYALYGNNPPAGQFSDYAERIWGLIWEHASRIVAVDRDVIIDGGFWMRASRDAARARVRAFGATPLLYDLRCPQAQADARVLSRSSRASDGVLLINQWALHHFRQSYEPLGDDEERITVDAGGSDQGH